MENKPVYLVNLQKIPDIERDTIFKEMLLKIPENDKCFDCKKKNPKWTSVYLGLLLCIDCSGKHREYSVKYSFVRSITLDSWSRKQITFMQVGGNRQAYEYFNEVGLISQHNKVVDYKSSLVEKYKIQQYQKVDQALSQYFSTNHNDMSVEQTPNFSFQQIVGARQIHQQNGGMNTDPEKYQCNLENEVTPKKHPPTQISFKTEPKSKIQIESGIKSKNVQGKKISNVDFDALTFDEHSNQNSNQRLDPFGQQFTSSDYSIKSFEEPKIISKTSGSTTDQSQDDQKAQKQLDEYKVKNVNSISSTTLFSEKTDEQDKQNIYKFNGKQAISSQQFFGEPEEIDNSSDNLQSIDYRVNKRNGKCEELFKQHRNQSQRCIWKRKPSIIFISFKYMLEVIYKI